jgi:lysophospholipase L1-like esterase
LAGALAAGPRDTGSSGAGRLLALGDSYTIGEGVGDADRWPAQLAARLRMMGQEVAPPVLIARTGWTVGELSDALSEQSPQGPFDLVTLLIGVNDEYRGGRAAAFRPAFEAMLRRAIALAGGSPGRVIVLSIPDWSVTPFAVASGRDPAEVATALREFNAVVLAAARSRGCRTVDITAESRRALGEPGLLAADGLHPSARMYARWVEKMLPEVVAALGSRAAP